MKSQGGRVLIGAGVALALLSGLIWLSKVPILEGYRLILQGAIGIPSSENAGLLDAWDNTLHEMTPILLTGLAVALALQAGLFNIGAAGQLTVGACAAAWIGARFSLHAPFHLPFALLAGAAAGAVWAWLPAWLKMKRGAHEVITTIMFNYLALYLTHWLVTEVIKDPESDAPKTAAIAETAQLPFIGSFLFTSWGFVLAVALALVLWALLFQTVWGYETRATGSNPDAAQAAGIPIHRRAITAFMLSGALAGLAGAVEVCGLHYNFFEGFPNGYGFDGIAVALLAGNHPALTIGTAYLFGALQSGTYNLHVATGAPKEIAIIMQGVLILFALSLRLGKRAPEK